jgi:hypothetical protein
MNGKKWNSCRILAGNLERKRQVGRPIYRWVVNIRTDLGEIGSDGMGWIVLA